MYRHNIFHILYPVACLIGLFVVYQAWFKPTYLPTPPPDQPNAVVENVQNAPPELPRDGPMELEPKQTRLIDHSVVPKTTHHVLLETIRDEIEKGNVKLRKRNWPIYRQPSQTTTAPAPMYPSSGTIWAFNRKNTVGPLPRSRPSRKRRHSMPRTPSSN